MFLSILVPGSVLALQVEVGVPPPTVTLSKSGEVKFNGDGIAVEPWNSSSLTGRIRVVQHLGGRTPARQLTEKPTAAITAASCPPRRSARSSA